MTGYTEEDDGTVALRMTRDDYERLLLVLGFATAKYEAPWNHETLALADRLNEGNPRWRRYTEKTE